MMDPPLDWPWIEGRGREPAAFVRQFEWMAALANAGRGLSPEDKVRALGQCLGEPHLQEYEMVIAQRARR